MFTNEPGISHDNIKRYLADGRRLHGEMWVTTLWRTASMVRRGVAAGSDAVQQMIKSFVRNHRRYAYLHALQSLNDGALKDIGLHRSEIYSVVNELVDNAPPPCLADQMA
ncbi:MAG: DUF1127 domain-containing protein [Acidiferrobacterales bacterium]